MAVRIVAHAFEIIHLLTDQNPLQILVDAIINTGPREDSTRIGSQGTVRRQAVDVSPLRRVNQAIALITIGVRESAFRNVKVRYDPTTPADFSVELLRIVVCRALLSASLTSSSTLPRALPTLTPCEFIWASEQSKASADHTSRSQQEEGRARACRQVQPISASPQHNHRPRETTRAQSSVPQPIHFCRRCRSHFILPACISWERCVRMQKYGNTAML